MTDRTHKLSLTRQAALLGISRGSPHYAPRPVSDAELKLMRRIDELHMDYPFAGSRMMKGLLRQDGFATGGRSNTKRSTCTPMPASQTPAKASVGI